MHYRGSPYRQQMTSLPMYVVSQDGDTALIRASNGRHVDEVVAMLNVGADLNTKNKVWKEQEDLHIVSFRQSVCKMPKHGPWFIMLHHVLKHKIGTYMNKPFTLKAETTFSIFGPCSKAREMAQGVNEDVFVASQNGDTAMSKAESKGYNNVVDALASDGW